MNENHISVEKCAHVAVRSLAEASTFAGTLVSRMTKLGYSHMDRFSVRFALEESVANAITHGHKGDQTKPVQVSYLVMPEYVLVEVGDQGSGFDPALVPNPMTKENRERPNGRGLFLMRLFMTWVRFHNGGRRVTMCKMRAPERIGGNAKGTDWFSHFAENGSAPKTKR
jgi:serine/threonine-protein kinase RsbW